MKQTQSSEVEIYGTLAFLLHCKNFFLNKIHFLLQTNSVSDSALELTVHNIQILLRASRNHYSFKLTKGIHFALFNPTSTCYILTEYQGNAPKGRKQIQEKKIEMRTLSMVISLEKLWGGVSSLNLWILAPSHDIFITSCGIGEGLAVRLRNGERRDERDLNVVIKISAVVR